MEYALLTWNMNNSVGIVACNILPEKVCYCLKSAKIEKEGSGYPEKRKTEKQKKLPSGLLILKEVYTLPN